MTAQINIFPFPVLRVSAGFVGLIEKVKVEEDSRFAVCILRPYNFAIDYTRMMQLLPCMWFTKGKYILGMTMIVRANNFRACVLNTFFHARDGKHDVRQYLWFVSYLSL